MQYINNYYIWKGIIMNKNNFADEITDYINYKDIIILTGLWFLIISITSVLHQKEFIYHTPLLKGVFNFLFTLASRFIFLALAIFYLISLYEFSLKSLHINFNRFKSQIQQGFIICLFFFIFVLLFINIPLSYNLNSTVFKPLYLITSPLILARSLFSLSLIFISSIIIALSEQLFICRILYTYLTDRLNNLFGIIISSLSYSLILADLTLLHVLIHSLVGFISIFLYKKSKSLIFSSIFGGFYYALYIAYIYGWKFPNF